MNFIKASFLTLAVVSILGIANTASANTYTNHSVGSYQGGLAFQGRIEHEKVSNLNKGERLFGSSTTASFFYKKGTRNFDRGNLDKAEKAFRASLRANGSIGLDARALLHLIYINQQQGDGLSSEKYKQAYLQLAGK